MILSLSTSPYMLVAAQSSHSLALQCPGLEGGQSVAGLWAIGRKDGRPGGGDAGPVVPGLAAAQGPQRFHKAEVGAARFNSTVLWYTLAPLAVGTRIDTGSFETTGAEEPAAGRSADARSVTARRNRCWLFWMRSCARPGAENRQLLIAGVVPVLTAVANGRM